MWVGRLGSSTYLGYAQAVEGVPRRAHRVESAGAWRGLYKVAVDLGLGTCRGRSTSVLSPIWVSDIQSLN